MGRFDKRIERLESQARDGDGGLTVVLVPIGDGEEPSVVADVNSAGRRRTTYRFRPAPLPPGSEVLLAGIGCQPAAARPFKKPSGPIGGSRLTCS